MGAKHKAVFLDRDGTLNEERKYLSDPDKLVLIPGVVEALRQLRDAGFLLFVVTNQSGIGRGYYTIDDMHRVNTRLLAILEKQGIEISNIYFAPEAPENPSRGRKPSPQFLQDARDQFEVDLSRSFMIGDKVSDVRCGENAGVAASILVRTGYGAEHAEKHSSSLATATIVPDLSAAALWILAQ